MNFKVKNPMGIISGSSNPDLAVKVADGKLIETNIKKFSDGEISVEILKNVRGKDIFVIQSLCHPVNDNLMELFLILDALKRSNVKSVTAVIPYFGYARQDRKVKPRVPISAKLVADLIQKAGINRLLTVDLHAGQIQGFFDCPVDNLYASQLFLNFIKQKFGNDLTIVSPDSGGVDRAKAYAKLLNAKLAVMYKYREESNSINSMELIGTVNRQNCIILDDMVDTMGTLQLASIKLHKNGAKSINAFATHGVLSGPAIERFKASEIDNLYITDSIPFNQKEVKGINIISISDMLKQAITCIYEQTSISALFEL